MSATDRGLRRTSAESRSAHSFASVNPDKYGTVSRMSSGECNTDTPDSNLVCIFRTGDERLVSIAASILEGDGIQYVARSADPQDLLDIERVGGSFSFAAGAVDFMVQSGDAARARTILDALRRGFLGGATEDKGSEKP